MHFEQTADSDTVSTYQVSSVQLVTDKLLVALNKAQLTIHYNGPSVDPTM